MFRKSLRQANLAGLEAYHYLQADYYYMGICYDYLRLRHQAEEAFKKVLDMDENELISPHAKECLEAPCFHDYLSLGNL